MSTSEFSFRGILFDMDGLLLDSERLSYESFCTTASAYDISVTMADYRQMIGLNHVTGLGVLGSILPSSLDPTIFKNDWLLAYRALVDDGVPVIVLLSNDALNEKTRSNAAEVVARGARLIEVGCGNAADQLKLPSAPNLLEPFLQALAVQMISYFAALAKGTDVDQPKNLAKSVTVE